MKLCEECVSDALCMHDAKVHSDFSVILSPYTQNGSELLHEAERKCLNL